MIKDSQEKENSTHLSSAEEDKELNNHIQNDAPKKATSRPFRGKKVIRQHSKEEMEEKLQRLDLLLEQASVYSQFLSQKIRLPGEQPKGKFSNNNNNNNDNVANGDGDVEAKGKNKKRGRPPKGKVRIDCFSFLCTLNVITTEVVCLPPKNRLMAPPTRSRR